MRLFLIALIISISISACIQQQKTNAAKKSIQKSNKNVDEEQLYSGLYQFYSTNPTSQDQIDENAIIDYAVEQNLELRRSESSLYYKIEGEADGENINWGEKISVHYRGYFLDGTEFDNSYKRGEPITFLVGNMVPGWNEGLRYMKKGQRANIILPSRLGYAEKGFPGYVEPNTVIAFELEVLE